MKRTTIDYEDEKVLKALEGIGEILGFRVADPENDEGYADTFPDTGETYLSEQDLEGLRKIFTGLDLDARALRRGA